MNRTLAAACAASFVLSVTPAVAALNSVTVSSSAGRIITTFHLSTATSWAYVQPKGTLTKLPVPVENASPIGGVGVVVKKICCCPTGSGVTCSQDDPSYSTPSPVNRRGPTPLAHLNEAGSYTVAISLPPSVLNAMNRAARQRPVSVGEIDTLWFTVLVDSKGRAQLDPRHPPGVDQRSVTENG